MSETDSLVSSYLMTVSDKLAKQFAKKRPSPAPWNGPGLVELIAFYKKHCQEKENVPAVVEIADGEIKRGKKRKLSETKEEIAPAPPIKKTKKKEKKKNKKKKAVEEVAEVPVPDVVEVVPVCDDKTTPEVEQTEQSSFLQEETEIAVIGGLVGVSAEEANGVDANGVEANGVEANGDAHVNGADKRKPKKSKLKKQSASFRRVKEEDIEIKNEELANNTFEAKGGADQFGFKANQILKFTKGKSFRHEKTKKKRGTYKGGSINMGVTSIKFDSD